MSERELTSLERQALGLLLSPANSEDESLVRQIDSLVVKSRECSGVGMFVKFDVPEECASSDKRRKTISNLSGEMTGLQNGFGGVLYVENGKLKTLEFFTYDEHWPSNPSEFSLRLDRPNR